MKKLILFTMLICSIATTEAQGIMQIPIETVNGDVSVCLNLYNTVELYTSCNSSYYWLLDGEVINANPIVIVHNDEQYFDVGYSGCDLEIGFILEFINPQPMPTPFTHVHWKKPGHTDTLQPVASDSLNMYHYIWSTGETTPTLQVTETGIYSCDIFDDYECGSTTRTFIVRDNVELYRATVDLETNLNKVTWQTNEAQAEYISQVKVYRDGFFVGTAPYENGYFLDAIGSDNAARNYQIVGVTPEGVESPASHQKGTIHTTYYLDVNDNLNMTWNIPYVEQGAQGSLTYFQICKYDPNTEQLTVVDQVNSLITDYTCGVNQFAGGYPVIAAVFSDAKNGEFEDLSFSNMYTDIAIQPQDITITLMPGWNWISYPYAVSMNIAVGLGDFIPAEGDIINSQSGGTTTFVSGQWRGLLKRFTPGLGYMYYSSRNESVTLVFGESRKIMVK